MPGGPFVVIRGPQQRSFRVGAAHELDADGQAMSVVPGRNTQCWKRSRSWSNRRNCCRLDGNDLAGRIGHTTGELSYLKEQQAREMLRTIVLKVMADNRLDALVYAPAEREPALIPATTTLWSKSSRSRGMMIGSTISAPRARMSLVAAVKIACISW